MDEPPYVALLPDDLAAYCRETAGGEGQYPRWSIHGLNLLVLARILAELQAVRAAVQALRIPVATENGDMLVDRHNTVVGHTDSERRSWGLPKEGN